MVPQPLDPHRAAPVSPWLACPSASDGSYVVAALRAAAIALVLLTVLALLVWF